MKGLKKAYVPNLKRKKCSKCGHWKYISEFHRHSSKPDGLSYQCKQCVSERQKPYYQKNKAIRKEKQRSYYRKSNPKKRCTRCGRSRRVTSFYPNNKWCKSCVDMVTKGSLDDIKQQIYARRYYKKHQKKELKKAKDYREQNKLHVKAHRALERAIRRGQLVKPSRCSNPNCPGIGVGRIEGHHKHYDQEHWLYVDWYCSSCHKLLGKKKITVKQLRKPRSKKRKKIRKMRKNLILYLNRK